MTNNSNLLRELEFTKHYHLNSVPESLPLIQLEHSHKSADLESDNSKSKADIVFALGLLITLMVFSGVRLYRSVNNIALEFSRERLHFVRVTPTLSTFNTEKALIAKSEGKLERRSISNGEQLDFLNDKIELVILKNTVAKGKF